MALQLALFAVLQALYVPRYNPDHFLAAWIDKHARLHALKPPRVLLVGGSGWAFGVQSARLGRALGLPVVNLGLTASPGREFILRDGEKATRPGDLVVVSLEYALMGPDQAPDPLGVLELVSVAPSAARFVPASDLPALLDATLGWMARRPRVLALAALGVPAREELVYARHAFGPEGDMAGPHESTGSIRESGRVHGLPSREQERRLIERLKLFAQRVRVAGGRPFLSLTPIPEGDFGRQTARFAALARRLQAELTMPVLESDAPAYPNDVFFDTSYHLTPEGARQRTRALIVALRARLAEQGVAP